MSETYLVTARTVEEAIAVANREYADANHDVSYEILEMPKKGFLGIGSKDAKIKITVTKISSVSSELGSIVNDIRNLKKVTARGEEDKPKQNQPKQNNQPKQEQKPKQNNQNQPKQEAKAEAKPVEQKSAQSNQPKQEQKPVEQKPVEPKLEQKPVQNNQPKQPKQEVKAEAKPVEQKPAEQKPVQNNQPKQPKPEQKSEPKPEAKAEPKSEPKQEVKQEVKAEPKSEPKLEQKADETAVKFGDTNAEYKSSLKNSAGGNRRQPQAKKVQSESAPVTEDTAVAVSAPVGLTDFVSDENRTGFGSYEKTDSKSSGRIGNDIRRKNNAPKKAEAPAQSKPVTPEASAAPKYDIAESDEDYAKLERLDRSYKKGAAKAEKLLAEAKEAKKAEEAVEATEAAEEAEEAVKAIAAEAVSDISETEAEVEEEEVPAVPEERKREGITQAEMDYALAFANTLLENMNLHARARAAECPEGEEYVIEGDANIYPKIDIVGDDTGVLIGHHGETLDSIQYLTNLSALRKTKSKDGDYVKIVVDIEGYREKREQTLRALAHRMAAKAVAQKRNVFLEPMNAYERRIIHSELQSYPNVSTHSVGSDRDRKIIVTYEGADKVQYTPNRARRKPEAEGENRSDRSDRDNPQKRRPRKPQKMPIEKISDILPDSAE